jgi:integrase
MSSKTLYQTVGNTVAQWEEDSPLRWTMQEPARKNGLKPDPIECDLSGLAIGYTEEFLLALKETLISSRHRLALRSISANSKQLQRLLEHVYNQGFDGRIRVSKIDRAFLIALHALAENIPFKYLLVLRAFHESHRDDERLFDRGLHRDDFPVRRSKRGDRGDRMHSILAKALCRSTLVHVLDMTESAFEAEQVDLGRYAFLRLALHIFCRPESYRRLTLADLRVDTNPQSGAINYFLDVLPAKSRVHDRKKITYRLHPEVGKLLEMQRQAVVERYGHLAPQDESGSDYGQLALFPAICLKPDESSWGSAYASENAGMLRGNAFDGSYIEPIRSLTSVRLGFNILRHTIGTQLAQMGCSAHTIQAVLKHASNTTCQTYVDIVFQGLIDELSDGLQPAFDEHFPVFTKFASKTAPIPVEQRIVSEDLDTGRVETTAMCGRKVACSYAPIVCYACPRFIPCYDADHTINLDVVEREIQASEGRGLAMQHDVQRWRTIRNHIRLVIAACDNKRRALETKAAAQRGVTA